MPIYEQAYRKYEARAPLRQVRFWPITREALRALLAKRAFVVLLMACFVPFVFATAVVYASSRLPQVGLVLPTDARLFGMFLNFQIVAVVLLSTFGGAGSIANDLRTGAILVYLSRPLSRRDYVLGKLGAPLVLNLAVTLLPGLLLYIIALGLVPEQFAKWTLCWISPAIVAHSLLISVVMSLLVLGVSALSRSARVAGLGFVGTILGLEAIRVIVRLITGRAEADLIAPDQNLTTVGGALFGMVEGGQALHTVWPTLVLALIAAGCLLVLRSRVRAVEIVK